MTVPAYSASARWYRDGHCGYDLRTMKSAGGILDLVEFERPAGDMSRSGLPDLVLCQDMLGGSRLVGNLGGGRFDVASEKGDLTLAAPNFALTSMVDTSQQVRALAFPVAQWQEMLDDAADGRFSFIQMATTKSWMRRSMERGNAPTRASAFRDPAMVERFTWAPAAETALSTARPDPNHPVWPTLEAALRSGISAVLTGQRGAKAALDDVAVDWERSLRRAGLLK